MIADNSTEPPHSGTWDAWLDGYSKATTDTLAQTVTIPAGITSATLTYWMHIDTKQTTTTSKIDTLKLQILNSSGTVLRTVYTYSNLNAASGYQQHSATLTSYKGQTITIKFTGVQTTSTKTSFVLDDFSLTTK